MGILLLLIGGLMGSGSLGMLFCAFGAGFWGLAALSLCHELAPGLWSVKFLCIAFCSQPLFLGILTALGYFEGVGRFSLPVFPPDTPLVVAFGLMIIPVAITLCAFLYRIFAMGGAQRLPHEDWLRRPPQNLPYFLTVGAFISLSVWFTPILGDNAVSYVVRVLYKALFLIPMLAGIFSTRYPRTTLLWLVVLACNLGLSMISGSRSWGFIPAMLYGFGIFLSAPRTRKIRLAIIGVPAVIALFVLAGVTSLVRESIGRGGGEIVSAQRVNDALIEASAAVSGGSLRGALEAPIFKGLTRAVFWTNVVVPIMSPDGVAYRGIGGIKAEVISAVSLGREGEFHTVLIANEYGFLVNEGTSVEFGILPDGWSRGGPLAAFGYGVVGTVFLILAEVLIARAFSRYRALMIVLLCYVFYVSILGFVSYSLIAQMRLAILCIGFMAVLFFPLELLTSPKAAVTR